MGSTVIDGLGLIGWGIIIGSAGLLLLFEYRKVFFEDPKTVMTLEVIFQLARAGGPGYLASMLLFCAAMFVLGGIATIIFVAISPFI